MRPRDVRLLAWTVLGSATKGTAAEAEKAPHGLRVFCASHSMMWYVPKPLGELAEAAGISGHKLAGLQKTGVSRTLPHWHAATHYTCSGVAASKKK